MAQLCAQSHSSRCFTPCIWCWVWLPSPQIIFICFCICSLWKKHPDSCDVFIMSRSWFSSNFVTSILTFLPKLKNSSHFELRESSTCACVVWSFRGRDGVEGCYCVRSLHNVAGTKRCELLIRLEWSTFSEDPGSRQYVVKKVASTFLTTKTIILQLAS